MDKAETDAAIALDPAWTAQARATWLALIELSVLGDVKSAQIGAVGKLRKRALEVGEKLQSLCASRAWIPQPRAQLKNALASALALRGSVQQYAQALQEISGGEDWATLRLVHAEMGVLLDRLQAWENRCAGLLESQNSLATDQ